MNFFKNRTVLITGASAGLGSQFARQLAPHAGTLLLVARRLDRLTTLQNELQSAHPALRVLTYGVDLADETKIDELLGWISEHDLRVDFLINNAGLGDHGPFEKSDWEKIKEMLAVNVVALTKLTCGLLQTLRLSPRGAILNVSSIAGLMPVPDLAVYAATKAYVSSFSEALRVELRTSGISVTALCPGPVDTEFGEVANREDERPMPTPEFFKVSAEEVVRSALHAVATGRARVVPGWVVAGAMAVVCMLPMFLLRLLLNRRR